MNIPNNLNSVALLLLFFPGCLPIFSSGKMAKMAKIVTKIRKNKSVNGLVIGLREEDSPCLDSRSCSRLEWPLSARYSGRVAEIQWAKQSECILLLLWLISPIVSHTHNQPQWLSRGYEQYVQCSLHPEFGSAFLTSINRNHFKS